VYQSNGKWVALVTKYYHTDDNGKRRPKRVKKRDALNYIFTLLGASEKNVQTLDYYWQTYEKSSLPKLSEDRQVAYKIAKKKLEGIFHTPVNALSISDLQQIIDEKAQTHYPARDMKTVLSHLYHRAVAQQDVLTNLSEYIELPNLDEGEQIPFSSEEQGRLWELF